MITTYFDLVLCQPFFAQRTQIGSHPHLIFVTTGTSSGGVFSSQLTVLFHEGLGMTSSHCSPFTNIFHVLDTVFILSYASFSVISMSSWINYQTLWNFLPNLMHTFFKKHCKFDKSFWQTAEIKIYFQQILASEKEKELHWKYPNWILKNVFEN